jgi:hypothetical protein
VIVSEKIVAECVGGPYDGLQLEMPSERPQLVRFPVKDRKKMQITYFSLALPLLQENAIEVFDFYEFEKEIEIEVEGMNPDQVINIMTYAGRGIME